MLNSIRYGRRKDMVQQGSQANNSKGNKNKNYKKYILIKTKIIRKKRKNSNNKTKQIIPKHKY